MTKNIKEIGKELLGKSLNSFHKKTGLTQLEKNNEMQDGILNGILSQVDDAYIEKIEQSNVIHLDGSGDGVVVLDSIEGNTMVNLWDINKNVTLNVGNFDSSSYGIRIVDDWVEVKTNGTNWVTPANRNFSIVKPNTLYTVIFEIKDSTYTSDKVVSVNVNYPYTDSTTGENLNESCIQSATNTPLVNGITTHKFTTREHFNGCLYSLRTQFQPQLTGEGSCKFRVIMLEGDWTNKEIPSYFEGLQSSFEEKVNDEGKYEIEILSNNRNLLPKDSWTLKDAILLSETKDEIVTKGKHNVCGGIQFSLKNLKEGKYCFSISAKTHTQGDGSVRVYNWTKQEYITVRLFGFDTSFTYKSGFFNIPKNYENDEIIIWLAKDSDYELETQFTFKKDFMLTKVNSEVALPYGEQKHNKIKLLINEPLRAIETFKDKLCVKNGQLVVERNLGEDIIDGSERWEVLNYPPMQNGTHYQFATNWSNKANNRIWENSNFVKCDRLTTVDHRTTWSSADIDGIGGDTNRAMITFKNSTSPFTTISEVKQWLSQNPLKVVYPLAEPYYEEVTNEYGEPILLEGYENGTIYIDSTIVPTTTARYTPKMESLNTLKEVNNNNVMLTNDINDMIVPYMMEVDLMIMEKEFALMSAKNIRKVGEKDMTSMQKRTQDMLERLIKGRTLTEQECKTRVTTYLNAGKITDTQAEELMLLINEVYA